MMYYLIVKQRSSIWNVASPLIGWLVDDAHSLIEGYSSKNDCLCFFFTKFIKYTITVCMFVCSDPGLLFCCFCDRPTIDVIQIIYAGVGVYFLVLMIEPAD